MPKDFRYPDKPTSSTLDFISGLKSNYLAQAKINEWRILMFFENKKPPEIFTRHATTLKKALKQELDKEILDTLKEFNPTELTIIDGGYIGRRGKHKPSIVLFDIMKKDSKWVTHWQYEKRDTEIKHIFKQYFEKSPCIFLPEESRIDFGAFYEKQKTNPKDGLVEGIVVKELSSTLIGGRKESVDNPCWFKAKW